MTKRIRFGVGFSSTTPGDWSRKLTPPFQSIRSNWKHIFAWSHHSGQAGAHVVVEARWLYFRCSIPIFPLRVIVVVSHVFFYNFAPKFCSRPAKNRSPRTCLTCDRCVLSHTRLPASETLSMRWSLTYYHTLMSIS